MVTPSALRLELHDIQHGYTLKGRDLPVIDNVSLTAAPGEFVVLLGPSGCGKSTLLRLAAGLEFPRAGKLLADGQIITGPAPERVVMFQDPTLFPWRTVRRNVALGQDISGKRAPQAVDAAINLVKLGEFADAWPHQLSGGMAQRAALARALVNEPRLLILDEPLGKLDSLTRLTMQSEIARLWRERGFTALMVTHDVEEALMLASRIVVLSTRPTRVLSEIVVDLPGHRHRDDTHLINLRRDILDRMGHHQDW